MNNSPLDTEWSKTNKSVYIFRYVNFWTHCLINLILFRQKKKCWPLRAPPLKISHHRHHHMFLGFVSCLWYCKYMIYFFLLCPWCSSVDTWWTLDMISVGFPRIIYCFCEDVNCYWFSNITLCYVLIYLTLLMRRLSFRQVNSWTRSFQSQMLCSLLGGVCVQ